MIIKGACSGWHVVLLGVAMVFLSPGGSTIAAESDPETVVLLHGLGRTHRAMAPLERRLRAEGFEVHNLRYASTGGEPGELVRAVRSSWESCCSDARVVHFVGHSLGGILVRAMLAEDRPENLGRVVQLASPNQGSEWVDLLGRTPFLAWSLGPTATELGTGMGNFPSTLPAPDYELGVIAGTRSVNPLGSLLLPDPNDGTVTVESTRLAGMADFLIVPHSHTFIMRSGEVAAQVAHFLRDGEFSAPDTGH